MSINTNIRDEYLTEFQRIGSEKFFESVLLSASKNIKDYSKSTEIIVLDQAESFFALYRKTGNDSYNEIAKILRRVAHKIYRAKRKINKEMPMNRRFLEII
jgi:hypothetical protein